MKICPEKGWTMETATGWGLLGKGRKFICVGMHMCGHALVFWWDSYWGWHHNIGCVLLLWKLVNIFVISAVFLTELVQYVLDFCLYAYEGTTRFEQASEIKNVRFVIIYREKRSGYGEKLEPTASASFSVMKWNLYITQRYIVWRCRDSKNCRIPNELKGTGEVVKLPDCDILLLSHPPKDRHTWGRPELE